MKGQWIGKYQGSVDGDLMINVDEVNDHFEAVIYIMPREKGKLPTSVAYLSTTNKLPEQKTTAYIQPVDPRTGFRRKWEEIKGLYNEDVSHSNTAEVSIKLVENKLYINAISDINITISSVLEKPLEKNESRIPGENMSWREFKSYLSDIPESKYLFRGQKNPWKLRTSLHRRGRYRISQFTDKDVKQLHQKLSAITSHYFDLSVPNQNGSFFNLLQHHGYPTPLLDWSYSPYVSAFFAFRDWPIKYMGKGDARIYIFDNETWQKKFSQIQNLDPPCPHLSVSEFIAIDNPRLVPQQAVTTITNIDDIEAYVIEKELETKVKFLQAIDIPASDRTEAMRDLKFMGITAGSMFPSIDGVCEELKEANFDK